MTDAETLWKGCAALVRDQVSSAVWKTSFQPAKAESFDGSTLVLSFPSTVVRERVADRYLPILVANMTELGHDTVVISLTTRAQVQVDRLPFEELEVVRQTESPVPAARHGLSRPNIAVGDESPTSLNERYTFDAFVTGGSNNFAHAAALRVAETPARNYNPLFIYGDAGLGKTHLLQAIGNYVVENYSQHRVKYVTSEQFLSEFVDSIRAGENEAFKRRYRDIDVLMVDDVQFFEGKKETQEEFFHTFNHLHQANRQIVLSSDRPPDAIHTLEDRLRTRFKMGLLTDIQPPDLETRLAILRKKAEDEGSDVPPEVLHFVAEAINDNNIRSLEGALTRLTAWASLTRETLTTDQAAEILSDLVGEPQARPITPTAILDATAEYFSYSVEELIGRSRTRPLTSARHVSMYLFRELTDLSYPNIAKEFGGRDHTTIIHAVDRITEHMRERRQVFQQVSDLINILKNGK